MEAAHRIAKSPANTEKLPSIMSRSSTWGSSTPTAGAAASARDCRAKNRKQLLSVRQISSRYHWRFLRIFFIGIPFF